ncbi:helix-turn-helix transcriptional regulator [Pontibacillus marinus]|uniref:HTH merR-type domain-containing protein n=1 Tax=Pontibacillus marinus BH030004 = DSM 16465 TaxID=1385511 RepID=A0A0A5HP76_9BACI|nr:hypothetical protein [Pontibacillus marinus]KGX85422.1 hypothetical protein N783_14615 [Pontibacillus marinus BH030004 = DSM 16465]
MRHDIRPNERAYSTKEVAEEVGLATTTVRKYGQILERNGYEFFKDGDRRIFVRSDIEAIIAIRDTEKPKDDTAKEVMEKQKARLEEGNETSVTLPDTYDNSLQDPNQLKDLLKVLANELAATNEMNTQLRNDVSHLKTAVSQLQQDHHAISSGVGNFSQKTHTNMEKLMEQQKNQYESLLEQEKEKSEFLLEEIRNMREDQNKEWQLQSDFNKRLEENVHKESIEKPKGFWAKLLFLLRK